MKELSVILAVSNNGGIGYKNTIPWDIPEELSNFKRITSETSNEDKFNCVIMGKNTWFSIKKPLKNRFNIVVSSTLLNYSVDNNIIIKKTLKDAIDFAQTFSHIEKIFIIGGACIYEEMFEKHMNMIDKVHLSVVFDKNYICDKFVNIEKIYRTFYYDKDNIKKNDRYIYMLGTKRH